MTKTPRTPVARTDDGIPAFLKRETNAKGISLSAGAAPVTATAAKVEQAAPAAPKPLTKKEQAKVEAAARRAAAEAAKAAAAAEAAKVEAAKAAVTAEPALGPDGQPLEKVKRSIVPMKFKERYKSHGGTCGDDMALELKAATTTRNADKREVLDVEALWAIAKVNEIDVSKYVDLNNGQKRMNVGNKLRGKLAAGADVVIGTRTFKAEDFTPKS